MAEAFKARAIGPAGFERDVVVKRMNLPAYGLCDEDFVRMFTDEARILGLILITPTSYRRSSSGRTTGPCSWRWSTWKARRCRASCGPCGRPTRRMPPTIAAYIGREICRALDCVHRLQDEAGGVPGGGSS